MHFLKSTWPRLAGIASGIAVALPAQHVVETTHATGQHPIVAVRGATPFFLNAQGKLAAAPDRLAVKPLPCYAEEAAVVHVMNAHLENAPFPVGSEATGCALRYRAELTASRALKSCYAVVWIDSPAIDPTPVPAPPSAGTARHGTPSPRHTPAKPRAVVALHELPDLAAGEKTSVEIVIPLPMRSSGAGARVLLFAGSSELLPASLGDDCIADERQKTREHVLATVANRPPTPFMRVAPRQPSTLRGRGVNAEAILRCRIDEHGDVEGITIESTTHPAFAAAAQQALQQWKFLPAIEEHRFVARSVLVPFHFQTPAAAPKPPAGSDRN